VAAAARKDRSGEDETVAPEVPYILYLKQKSFENAGLGFDNLIKC